MKKSKTYPLGRICEGDDCTVRLSIFNADHLCARCDEADRVETHEAERLGRLPVTDVRPSLSKESILAAAGAG